MNQTGETFVLETILANLQQLCSEKRTGNLFLVTLDKHTATLGLHQGNIVSAKYRIRRGIAALDDLLSVQAASFTFSSATDVRPDNPALPPTADILEMLGLSPASSGSNPQKSSGEFRASLLSVDEKQILVDLMTQIIGPMGAILCDDIFAKTVVPKDAIKALAMEVPNKNAAKRFVISAKHHLNIGS